MADEAKITVEEEVGGKVDEFLDGKEKSSESSTEDSTGKDTEVTKDPGTDQPKPEKSEVTEEEVPKEFHKNPAWQRILKERDEARQALEAQKGSVSEAQQTEYNRVISSPSYIRSNMKAQGYTDEAVDAKLREAGHDIPEKVADDYGVAVKALGLTLDQVKPQDKPMIQDVVKVASAIADAKIASILPGHLKPLTDGLNRINQTRGADKMMSGIKDTITKEGILNYEEDVEPHLDKFLDGNPNALQGEFLSFFKDLNHKLLLQRVATGKKKTERDGKKTNLRGSKDTVHVEKDPNTPTQKAGESDESFVGNVMEHLDIK